MLAPITPVTAEKLYRHLTNEESVHLANWPVIPEEYKDDAILEETEVIQRVITLARYLREKENIKIRQPLNKLELASTNKDYDSIINKFKNIICEEINVKDIVILKDISEIAVVEYKPNFSSLGPKFGPKMGLISKLVKDKDFKEVKEGYLIVLDGKEEMISKDDIEIRYVAKEGLKVENDKDIVATLDIHLTDELKEEGMAREIVRNVQDSRKALNLEISDRILLTLEGDVPTNWLEYIAEETLADFKEFDKADLTCEVLSNDNNVKVNIKKQ